MSKKPETKPYVVPMIGPERRLRAFVAAEGARLRQLNEKMERELMDALLASLKARA